MLAAVRDIKWQVQHSIKAIVVKVLPCCGFADMKDAAHLLDYALSTSPGVSLFIHGESLNACATSLQACSLPVASRHRTAMAMGFARLNTAGTVSS